MMPSSAVSKIEIIKPFPRSSSDSIDSHFAKFKFQPKQMTVNDIQPIYKSKVVIQRVQQLEFERRTLTGKLDGVGSLILYKLSQKYNPSVIHVDTKKSIVLNDLGIIIPRPYLLTNRIMTEPYTENVESDAFLSIKKIVDNANSEFDELNKGG